MIATGTLASGSVWPPARWQELPDDAPSRARLNRDETTAPPPHAEIQSAGGAEKACGGLAEDDTP